MTEIEVDYTVDSGVPIPVERHSTGIPISEMKVGDSILFPAGRRASVQTNASRIKRLHGKGFTVRKVNDSQCRIWRTK